MARFRRKSRRQSRAVNPSLELLEERTMLSLLGMGAEVVPPDVSYDATGQLAYAVATGEFDSSATPVSIAFTPGSRAVTIKAPRDFQLHFMLDSAGRFAGGVDGPDLSIDGWIDMNRNNIIDAGDYSGVLLTGEVMDFGYLDSGTTDKYDFRLTPTGGALMEFFVGKDIGMTMTSIDSTFANDFTMDFIGFAQGLVGPIDRLGSLSGRVYLDANNNGLDDGEASIAGVGVTLTGGDSRGNVINRTVNTGADGSYLFEDLYAGNYAINEAQPSGYADGIDSVGSAGGTLGDDQVTGINLAYHQIGGGYNFGELSIPTAVPQSASTSEDTPVVIALAGSDISGTTLTYAIAAGPQHGTIQLDGNLATYTPAGGYSGPDGFTFTVTNGAGVTSSPADVSITVVAVPKASLSGIVFVDFNNDGLIDIGETVIAGVPINLTGVDNRGQAVNLTIATDSDGAFIFLGLRPGTYALNETQPSGYTQGVNALGSAGGSLSGDTMSQIQLGSGVDAFDYTYGERPAAGSAVTGGQTATIGFWQNKNGQALIKSLNGSQASTQLGNWLADSFPRMFGALAGDNDLTGKSNVDIASFYQTLFKVKGQKLDAQVLAVAMATYVTNASLAGTAGVRYGFAVTEFGVGIATYNVGLSGAAFGVSNNTTLTVMDILLATDLQSSGGILYSGLSTLRNLANNVYDGINNAGDIS